MNAVQFLKQEHEKAKAEFAKVLSAPATKRGELWAKLEPELKIHEQIEDTCVYKPLSQDADGRDKVLAEWREAHQEEVDTVEDLLEEIEDLEPGSQEWLDKVTEVLTNLRSHIQEEEGQIFPRLSKVWDEARLKQAGQELEGMKASKTGAARH
jgi:hemerythrin-like domain-containing protein